MNSNQEAITNEFGGVPMGSESGESSANPDLKNVVLVGMSGSGKTTVGRHLSVLLGVGFLDLDLFIERTVGRSISRIFSDETEDGFRRHESTAVERLANIRSHVIAIGAGALQTDANITAIKKLGMIVCLRPSVDEISRRLAAKPDELKKRPLFHDLSERSVKSERLAGVKERVLKQEEARSKQYDVADIVLDGGYVTPETSACQIKDILFSMKALPNVPDRFQVWPAVYGS